jgi:hypothetical protein
VFHPKLGGISAVRDRITALFTAVCLMGALLGCNSATMQTQTPASGFQQVNLVSDVAVSAAHNDPRFIDPWGIAFAPGEPFWITQNNLWTAKVFDASGVP